MSRSPQNGPVQGPGELMWTTFGAAWLVALGGFLLLWLVSLVRRDASVVDFWWGPGFAAIALTAWWQAGLPTEPQALLLLGLIVAWALRLGLQLGARRLREGEEDPRYAEIRDAWKPGFWWKSLFVVFLLQAVLQGLVSVGPVMAMLSASGPVGPLGLIGGLIAIAGIVLQTVADTQLDRFRRDTPSGGLLTTGIRAVVRFPSYLGEIIVWSGISLVALEAGIAWALLSAALVFVLLTRVSGIPVIEERMLRTRPSYAAYRDRVPAILPRKRSIGLLFQGRA
ncbi:MAG: DUF1295 domain-containing protein [Pseudomonadota bacterium]